MSNEMILKLQNELISKIDFVEEDSNYKFSIQQLSEKYGAIPFEESHSIIKMILNLKQGVITLSKDKEGLVETSGNVGIVKIEKGEVVITELVRSSVDEKRREIELFNNEMAKNNQYQITTESSYPGWKYKPNSNLEAKYIEAYKMTHDNQAPNIEAIHAGVECGMIYEKMPNLELISIGPDIVDVHTVNETLYLESCKKVLATIIKLIEILD